MTKTNYTVYIAALAPATYFGLHNYDFVHRQAVDIGAGDIVATTLGVVAGVAAAFVLELAGVKAGTLMFQQKNGKRAVSVVLFLTYLTTAIATVVALLPASVATIIIAVLYYLANGIEDEVAVSHADEVARISAELATVNSKNAELVTEQQAVTSKLETTESERDAAVNALESLRAESETLRVELEAVNSEATMLRGKLSIAQDANLPRKTSRKPSPKASVSWRTLSELDRAQVRDMSKAEIVETYGVSDRTALNWSKK